MAHTRRIDAAAAQMRVPEDVADKEKEEKRLDAWVLAAGLLTQLPREGHGQEALAVVDFLGQLVRQMYQI